jgi:lipopolysaccharide biosynthesis glycosyltransferase
MPATPTVLIADEAYVLGLAAALRSIEQHTQPLPPIYVIDAGIAPDSRLKLQQVVDIQWIHVSNIEQAELQRQGLLPAPGRSCDGHASAACWLKLTLPQLLPSSVSKALYFDCDMFALTSLQSILQLDLGGAPAW